MTINMSQSVNSLMGNLSLTISKPIQILAKATAVALPIILLLGDRFSVTAEGTGYDMDCWVDCIINLACAPSDQQCMQVCKSFCYNGHYR